MIKGLPLIYIASPLIGSIYMLLRDRLDLIGNKRDGTKPFELSTIVSFNLFFNTPTTFIWI